MDPATGNPRDASPKDGASCFGVMTGCLALVFLLFSVLTVVALGKRWIEPSSTPTTSSFIGEQPPPSDVSNGSERSERKGWVNLTSRARAKHESATVRGGPGTQNGKLAELADGAPLVILEQAFVAEATNGAGTWFKVRCMSAKGPVVGWIHSNIVKTK